ncbi:MAG: DUF1501 domain-containing protein [Gammaproteobacteria bacterium]
MKSTKITRRQFLKTSLTTTVSIPVLSSLTSQLAFAATGNAPHTVINVFLRGGMDSLSALVPHADPQYYALRPDIAIPAEGLIKLSSEFSLHKAMEPLHEFYQRGELAFVAASGLGPNSSSRSHFNAQRRMEAGTDNHTQADGWVGRYVDSTRTVNDASFRAVSHKRIPKSLSGYDPAISFSRLSELSVQANDLMSDERAVEMLKGLYQQVNHPELTLQSSNAFSAIDEAANNALGTLAKPTSYGNSKLGAALHQIAELMISDVGLEAASLSMGGWDLHREMGTWDAGSMRDQLSDLSTALSAFYNEISGLQEKVTIVVMSEFGRRVTQNDSGGTDHGKGGMMMVLGKGINGGKVHGEWPGLNSLDENDLPIVTDYRQVLTEMLAVRMGRNDLVSSVFPDYLGGSYLGVMG